MPHNDLTARGVYRITEAVDSGSTLNCNSGSDYYYFDSPVLNAIQNSANGMQILVDFVQGCTIIHDGINIILPDDTNVDVSAGDIVRFVQVGFGSSPDLGQYKLLVMTSNNTPVGDLISDTPYGPLWDGVIHTGASKNTLYDKINAMISDVAFDYGDYPRVADVAPSQKALVNMVWPWEHTGIRWSGSPYDSQVVPTCGSVQTIIESYTWVDSDWRAPSLNLVSSKLAQVLSSDWDYSALPDWWDYWSVDSAENRTTGLSLLGIYRLLNEMIFDFDPGVSYQFWDTFSDWFDEHKTPSAKDISFMMHNAIINDAYDASWDTDTNAGATRHTIYQTIEDVKTYFDGLDQALWNQVNTNTSDINNLKIEVGTVAGVAAGAAALAASNSGRITTNSLAIASNALDISNNSSSIAGLRSDLNELDTRVDDLLVDDRMEDVIDYGEWAADHTHGITRYAATSLIGYTQWRMRVDSPLEYPFDPSDYDNGNNPAGWRNNPIEWALRASLVTMYDYIINEVNGYIADVIIDEAYPTGWSIDTTHGASRAVLWDKFEADRIYVDAQIVNTPYDPLNPAEWTNDTTHAPSRSAVGYGFQYLQDYADFKVSDLAYGPAWETGDFAHEIAPSQYQVYQLAQVLVSGIIFDNDYSPDWANWTTVGASQRALYVKILEMDVYASSLISDDPYDSNPFSPDYWGNFPDVGASKNVLNDVILSLRGLVKNTVYDPSQYDPDTNPGGWLDDTTNTASRSVLALKFIDVDNEISGIETVLNDIIQNSPYNQTVYDPITNPDGWVNDTVHAASRDVLASKFAQIDAYTGFLISDDAYNSGTWVQTNQGASKRVLKDKIELMINTGDYSVNWDSIAKIAPNRGALYNKFELVSADIASKVSDAPFGPGWSGETAVAPSQNALYDKFIAFPAELVSDATYDPNWDGVTDMAPSKNAVYDELFVINTELGNIIQDTVYAPDWETDHNFGASRAVLYDKFSDIDLTLETLIIDVDYNQTWFYDSESGASRRALYVKFEDVQSDIGALIDDTPYGIDWATSLNGATQAQLYIKFESLGEGLVSNDPYGPIWDGSNVVAPSQNAVYDKISVMVADIPFDVTWDGVTDQAPSLNAIYDKVSGIVSDTPYGLDWDGEVDIAPSQNAVYDKISVMVDNSAYSIAWDNVVDVAPSQNALYDKFEGLKTELISTQQYDSRWETEDYVAPSHSAMYNKIEAMVIDTGFGPAWENDFDSAASRNSLFDKITAIDTTLLTIDNKADKGVNSDITELRGLVGSQAPVYLNVIIGDNEAQLATGYDNIVIGVENLVDNTYQIIGNVVLGHQALKYLNADIANDNIAIGNSALENIVYGYSNIAIGDTAAGNDVNNLVGGIYIGGFVDATTSAENETIIGYNTGGHGSNTVTLGNSNVASTYLQGTVHIGGIANIENTGQIKFPAASNPSANVNTLDDYEEGTFTPAISIGGGTTGITYDYRYGRYLKIGKLLYIDINIHLTSKGSLTGEVYVTGLPWPHDGSGTCTPFAVAGFHYSLPGSYASTPMAFFCSGSSMVMALLEANGDRNIMLNTMIENGTYFRISGCYTP